MLDSSFFAGITTSSVAVFQSKEGVGLVRSQPRSFPSRASSTLGDRNQYEMAAMMRRFRGPLALSGNFAGTRMRTPGSAPALASLVRFRSDRVAGRGARRGPGVPPYNFATPRP